jgi:hypothetical protein
MPSACIYALPRRRGGGRYFPVYIYILPLQHQFTLKSKKFNFCNYIFRRWKFPALVKKWLYPSRSISWRYQSISLFTHYSISSFPALYLLNNGEFFRINSPLLFGKVRHGHGFFLFLLFYFPFRLKDHHLFERVFPFLDHGGQWGDGHSVRVAPPPRHHEHFRTLDQVSPLPSLLVHSDNLPFSHNLPKSW